MTQHNDTAPQRPLVSVPSVAAAVTPEKLREGARRVRDMPDDTAPQQSAPSGQEAGGVKLYSEATVEEYCRAHCTMSNPCGMGGHGKHACPLDEVHLERHRERATPDSSYTYLERRLLATIDSLRSRIAELEEREAAVLAIPTPHALSNYSNGYRMCLQDVRAALAAKRP